MSRRCLLLSSLRALTIYTHSAIYMLKGKYFVASIVISSFERNTGAAP